MKGLLIKVTTSTFREAGEDPPSLLMQPYPRVVLHV